MPVFTINSCVLIDTHIIRVSTYRHGYATSMRRQDLVGAGQMDVHLPLCFRLEWGSTTTTTTKLQHPTKLQYYYTVLVVPYNNQSVDSGVRISNIRPSPGSLAAPVPYCEGVCFFCLHALEEEEGDRRYTYWFSTCLNGDWYIYLVPGRVVRGYATSIHITQPRVRYKIYIHTYVDNPCNSYLSSTWYAPLWTEIYITPNSSMYI